MAARLRVVLAEELADELIEQGFEEFGGYRGALADTATIMTVTSTGLAVGANVCTILVARKELGDFVAALRDWVRRKATHKPGKEISIDISTRNGDDQLRAELKIEFTDGVPDIDASAVAAFMNSLFSSKAAQNATSAPE